jgi:hypothetical protein
MSRRAWSRFLREVRSFLAGQLGLLWDFSDHYGWDTHTRGQPLSLIRQHTGWRFPTQHDKEELAIGDSKAGKQLLSVLDQLRQESGALPCCRQLRLPSGPGAGVRGVAKDRGVDIPSSALG